MSDHIETKRSHQPATRQAAPGRMNDEGLYLDTIKLSSNRYYTFSSSRPAFPVEAPVLDGFGQVLHFDVGAACQVGDGAAYLEDAVVRPG